MESNNKQISEKNQKRSIFIALSIVTFFAVISLGFALWDFRLEEVLKPDDSAESSELAPVLDDIQNENRSPDAKKGNSELALKTAQSCLRQSSIPELQKAFDALKVPLKLEDFMTALKNQSHTPEEKLIFQSLEIDRAEGGELLSYEMHENAQGELKWKVTFLQNNEEGLGIPAPIPPELKSDNPETAFEQFKKRGKLKIEEVSHKIVLNSKSSFNYMRKNGELFALKLNFDGHGLGCNVNENDQGNLSCVCFKESLDPEENESEL